MGKSKNFVLSVVAISAVLVGVGAAVPASAANESVTADLQVTPIALTLDPGGQAVQKFAVTNLGPGTLMSNFRLTFYITLPTHVTHIETDPYADSQVYFTNNATGVVERIDCFRINGGNSIQCPTFSPFGAAAAPGWVGILSLLVGLDSDAPAGSAFTDGGVQAVESTQFGAVWTDANLNNNSRVPFGLTSTASTGTPALASLPTATAAGLILVATGASVFWYRRRVSPQRAIRSAANSGL